MYVGVVPYAVDEPESTHVTALALTSVAFVVVASYPVSVRTIELVLPAPQIARPVAPAAVPYAAPTASVPMVSSIPVPKNLTAAVRPVGNVYIAVDAIAVGVYVCWILPKDTTIDGTMSCLAVGVIVYTGAEVRATRGDAVVRVYVAPVDEIV